MVDSEGCPFCLIAKARPLYPPNSPIPPSSLPPDSTSPSSFIILSTPLLIGFLDIMPLTRGHILLCPRAHRAKLSDVLPSEAAELGRMLPVLSRVLQRVLGVEDWNVVQNNGRGAAQVVDHAHFHLIPRSQNEKLEGVVGGLAKSFKMFGRGQREEIDEEEGKELAAQLRDGIAEVLKELGTESKL